MAKVYDRCDEHVAHMPGVKAAAKAHAMAGAAKATATLTAHRHQGHARITVESGITDYHVTLNDERGDRAALAIEFGREGYTTAQGHKNAPAAGIKAVTGAFGL